MLERDFREICSAVMPGSWHWEEVEQVCGQAAWMGRGWMYREDLQEPGSFGRLRENISVFMSHCWAGERMDPGSAHRCVAQGQESAPWQLATWQVLIRCKRKQIPKKVVKHWSWESGSLTSSKVWDLDRTRPWATWSSGICAEEEAGLNDLQRCLPT